MFNLLFFSSQKIRIITDFRLYQIVHLLLGKCNPKSNPNPVQKAEFSKMFSYSSE